MLKKNILIPYEKYEKLMAQTKPDDIDGQCVSHTQHIEVNRDKRNEYGVKLEKDKDEPQKANVAVGLQKGGADGGVKFNATAAINNETSPASRSVIIDAPVKEMAYTNPRDPPGKRALKNKTVNRNWETF